jgi:NitT/TauT family transport system substrate-binding protein
MRALFEGRTCNLQRAMAALYVVAALGLPPAALAEVKEVQIARGFAIPHLPIMIMEHDKLLEKHALAGAWARSRSSIRKLAAAAS